ncbi:MAG TPA: HAMP domain-containing sensor histidine kinase [Candidatus Eisenbacteria bacterium]|nr:HAMP domain-containing sensor histidine kinase [Candidatus Eisenbacteria bacterium]
MMRIRLHWKILVATVLPLLLLTAAALFTSNRSISEQAQRTIREDLVRSATVFEDMMATRSEELTIASQVIVQDPKFFSVLTLPVPANDPELRATAEGVAADFNAITQADLFIVFDGTGHPVASVGRVPLGDRAWKELVDEVRDGGSRSRILVDGGRHFQVTVTAVRAGNRPVGALLLGAEIGRGLAERLRSLTRSEVTFVSGANVTGSTLSSEDRARLVAALADRVTSGAPEGVVFEVQGARTTYLTVARSIQGSDPGQAQVFAMQRSLEAETAFLGPMRLALIEIGFVAVLVSLVVGYAISRGVTAPVRSLVRGAQEMERGNYDYPLEVRGGDEVGYLTLRFREMRQQQRVYVKSLEEVVRLRGEFIDVASHELRTPLSILKGYLELLSQKRLGPLTPNQEEAVTAMEGSVAALTRIAEDAYRVAQIQSERLVLSPFAHDPTSAVEEGVERARVAGRDRGVKVHVERGDEVEEIVADRARLVEAVYHLVSNGIRFTPDGGEVRVRANREGEGIAIRVSDTGVGIAREKLGKLLARSFVLRDSIHHHSSSRLEFRSSGLGLGIPIARGVAEAHGGRLTAESVPGQGTTFVLWIPRGVSEEEAAA